MDTIRERIISAVGIKLERVRVSNQCQTDCGLSVNREVTRLNAERDLPAFVIFPGEESATRKNGFVEMVMDIAIEGHVIFGSLNPSKVKEQILGDVIKVMTDRLTIEDTTAGLADDVVYSTGGGVVLTDAGDVSVGVSTVFQIKYRFKSGDPFSQ